MKIGMKLSHKILNACLNRNDCAQNACNYFDAAYLAACVSWFLAFGAVGSTRSDFVAIRNRLLTIETLRSPVTICACVFESCVTPAISRPPSTKSSYARLKRPDAGPTRRWASSGDAAAVTTSVVAWLRSAARELRFCCTSWKLRPPCRNWQQPFQTTSNQTKNA